MEIPVLAKVIEARQSEEKSLASAPPYAHDAIRWRIKIWKLAEAEIRAMGDQIEKAIVEVQILRLRDQKRQAAALPAPPPPVALPPLGPTSGRPIVRTRYEFRKRVPHHARRKQSG